MVVLLTATVQPNLNTAQLQLKDSKERLRQYEEALLFYLLKTGVQKVVFCDNSGVSPDQFDSIHDIAESNDKKLEIISFMGNQERIALQGKGYGEGEIIAYAMKNSKLLQDDPDFVKITGRLIVDNIDALMKGYRGGMTFNRAEHTENNRVDTRLFMAPQCAFDEYLLNAYNDVQDSNGIFLEQIYYECIMNNGINVKKFARYPRIRGTSGSTGAIYSYKEWKCKCKDILEMVGYYKPKRI